MPLQQPCSSLVVPLLLPLFSIARSVLYFPVIFLSAFFEVIPLCLYDLFHFVNPPRRFLPSLAGEATELFGSFNQFSTEVLPGAYVIHYTECFLELSVELWLFEFGMSQSFRWFERLTHIRFYRKVHYDQLVLHADWYALCVSCDCTLVPRART